MENFDRKGIVMDYPTLERMMKDYRAGKISREQFKAEFGKMQRRFGIDYRVRGLADKNRVYVVYRGQVAEAHGNIFAWTWGGRKYAHNLTDFKRCVDRQKIKEALNGEAW